MWNKKKPCIFDFEPCRIYRYIENLGSCPCYADILGCACLRGEHFLTTMINIKQPQSQNNEDIYGRMFFLIIREVYRILLTVRSSRLVSKSRGTQLREASNHLWSLV